VWGNTQDAQTKNNHSSVARFYFRDQRRAFLLLQFMFCISAPRVFTSAISTARFYFSDLCFVFQRRAFLLPRSAPRVRTSAIYVLYFSVARFYFRN
jgi:hypothetical protein